MTLPSSGIIKISDIATEFGGSSPHSLSEYYRGGGLVPNTGTNAAVPTSGAIKLSDFYGSSNVSFSAFSNTFTSGSGNALIPSGAAAVVITIDSGGGGGGRNNTVDSNGSGGGGGGSRVIITRSILAGEWGTNLAYVVGAAGVGRTSGNGPGTAAANCTVTGTLNGGGISLNARGGSPGDNAGIPGLGGTASGGDTNTNGSDGSSGTTGGAGEPGLGGAGGASPTQSGGAAVTFRGGGGGGFGTATTDGGSPRIHMSWT